MILFRQASTLNKYIEQQKKEGKSIGFIPTMGALHEGHESLVRAAKKSADLTVCSIFVNPTQFNDPTDFKNYPVTIGNDILKLENNNCDILFLPSVHEMYPEGISTKTHYDIDQIESILEGYYRPGHFQGVCQVVDRLLHIIQPHQVYMGQKDYQQLLVIKKLVNLEQLPVEVVPCPTLREVSGLALSSRNTRLTAEQKENASTIYKMLMYIKANITLESLASLEKYAANNLLNNGFDKIDYVSIVHSETLSPVDNWDRTTPIVVLVAVFIGGVRLIDNMIIPGESA